MVNKEESTQRISEYVLRTIIARYENYGGLVTFSPDGKLQSIDSRLPHTIPSFSMECGLHPMLNNVQHGQDRKIDEVVIQEEGSENNIVVEDDHREEHK